MGWLFYHRDRGETNVEHFSKKLGDGHRIVAGATVGGVFYAAIQGDDQKTGAVAFLTRWVPRDYYNFGYKDIDESMGPVDARCPDRVLDVLTPVDDIYEGSSARVAAEWREACRGYNARVAAVRPGVRIKLYTSRGEEVFELADGRRNLFHRVEGGFRSSQRTRIPWWRNSNFEIVSEQQPANA